MHSFRSTCTAVVFGLLAFTGMQPSSLAATRTAQPSPSSSAAIVEQGFEVPDVRTAPDKFQYGPLPASGWTLAGNSGIAGNGSAFGNANAPQGNQVLVLQGNGTASLTFNVTSPDTYRLTFKAALRPANRQGVSVVLDYLSVGEAWPAGTSFQAFTFDALKLTSGSHTLTLSGLSPVAEGQSAFVDEVTLVAVASSARAWSNPATWGGTLPAAGDTAVIPAGVSVLLDSTVTTGANGMPNGSSTGGFVKDIQVDGNLFCADQDIQLSPETMTVRGRFVCGSPYSRYANKFTLSLRGDRQADSHLGMGNKVLAAMGSGAIELHGESRRSWTQLNGTVNPGATQMTVVGGNNWRAGDKLVLAPTGIASDEDEVVTITSTANSGTTINFAPPLGKKHYGLTWYASNASRSWLLDERGEVGLLTRNIRIEGVPSDASPQFGGHFMSMVGTQVHVSGIELYRMGQKAIKARYPFHWHLVGDAQGQYIQNSSVHESYNRCVVIHQTNKARVAENVCHDFIGHGYFLEDGTEQYNVIDRNLGVGARRPAIPDPLPPAGELPLETDYRSQESSGGLASAGPAIFWISNPTNTISNNVAAGTPGTAIWYHIAEQAPVPVGANPPPVQMNPNQQPFGVFNFNRAHSAYQGFSSCRDAGFFAGLVSSTSVLIHRLVVSNVTQGVWPCAPGAFAQNATFNELVVANTGNGMQAPSPFTFRNSAFIGHTDNAPPAADPSKENIWFAIAMYDQGFLMENVHFANYDQPNMSVFANFGGAGKIAGSRVSGLSFQNAPNISTDPAAMVTTNVTPFWNDVIHDLDGTLVGAGKAMVLDHPMMYDATCTRALPGPGIAGYACPYHYSQFRMDWAEPTGKNRNVTQLRSGGVLAPGLTSIVGRHISNFPNIPGAVHSYRFDAGIGGRDLTLALYDGMNGETSVHQIMDVPPTAKVIQNSTEPNQTLPAPREDWREAASRDDLKSGAGHRYYYDADASSLWVKMEAKGEDWHAADYLRVCMQGLSGGACAAPATSNPPLPVVAFTSSDRAAANQPFNVSASITASGTISSAKLFVDDVPVADDPLSPHVYNLTKPTGTYLLKLVVTNTANGAGATFTALQTLVVGEPAPRIEIAGVEDDGTYTPLNLPTLQYTTINPSSNAPRVHWVFDGNDQGEATGGTIAVPSTLLTQGKHEIVVAYAKTDGAVMAGGAKRTIYVANNGELADFEDGPDLRITFTPFGPNAAPVPFIYAWGLRPTTRIDNQDDINLFYMPYVANSVADARIRLKLTPKQNWSTFSRIEVSHLDLGFTLVLLHENGSETPLTWIGNVGQPTGLLSSYFDLSSTARQDVVGIELRHSPSAFGPNCPITLDCVLPQYLYAIRLLTQ